MEASKKHQVVRLPTVQLIGAQKAGTSAIADWIFEGGDFCRPLVFDGEPYFYSKEIHFFDDTDRFKQGVEFYGKRCRECNQETMDATPDTLPFPERVKLTYDAAGGDQVKTVKIIVILREPVSRELSLYNHLAFECRRLRASDRNAWHKQATNEDGSIMTFDEFVFDRSIPALERHTGPGRSTRHSLYATHLEKWFGLFDRKQILVLSYDELLSKPDKLQDRVRGFLGSAIPGIMKKSNSNNSQYKVQEPTCKAKQALQTIFDPCNERLYNLLASNPGPSMEQQPFRRF